MMVRVIGSKTVIGTVQWGRIRHWHMSRPVRVVLGVRMQIWLGVKNQGDVDGEIAIWRGLNPLRLAFQVRESGLSFLLA